LEGEIQCQNSKKEWVVSVRIVAWFSLILNGIVNIKEIVQKDLNSARYVFVEWTLARPNQEQKERGFMVQRFSRASIEQHPNHHASTKSAL
jgi:hypothetical protein